MFQKTYSHDSYYNLKAQAPRPMSTATEMFDTDFEDEDDNNSIIEIEDDYSPRVSMHSVSFTVLPSQYACSNLHRLVGQVKPLSIPMTFLHQNLISSVASIILQYSSRIRRRNQLKAQKVRISLGSRKRLLQTRNTT